MPVHTAATCTRHLVAAAAPPSQAPPHPHSLLSEFSHHPRFLRFCRCFHSFEGMRSQIQTAIPFALHHRRASPLQALLPPLLLAPAVTALSHTSPHTQLTLTSRPQAGNTPVHASFCSLCGVSADNAPVLAPPYSFIPFLVTGLCFVTCNPSA